MKAKLLFTEKKVVEEDFIMELVIWELPQKTIDRPHGYKYRLYFGDNEGNCLVRYDNETGKGDHKHIGQQESSYFFIDSDTLVEDFYQDVINCLKKQRGR